MRVIGGPCAGIEVEDQPVGRVVRLYSFPPRPWSGPLEENIIKTPYLAVDRDDGEVVLVPVEDE
jgi:hypothetical protein